VKKVRDVAHVWCTAGAQIKIMLIKKRKAEKVSKGYRLKKTTHKLIDKLQMIMKADQDAVITKACKMLYKQLAK
jgi:hypothetical protein